MSNRFRIACRMLRLGDRLPTLPVPRRSESPIDYLVRAGLAPHPHVAAEMLILGAGLTDLYAETIREIEKVEGTTDEACK